MVGPSVNWYSCGNVLLFGKVFILSAQLAGMLWFHASLKRRVGSKAFHGRLSGTGNELPYYEPASEGDE
jgi:hypothetical protein